MGTALSKSRPALAAALLLLACLPAVAGADIGTKIIERCTHGKSISGYSQQAYRRALAELPTEVEEYSPCGQLIRRAQLAAASEGGGSGAGGGGTTGATTPSPSERSALEKAPKSGAGPLQVGGEVVHPGVVHADIASALSSLPNPVLALLAFLLACALALGGRELRKAIGAHRSG